jgi:hypothetical protein
MTLRLKAEWWVALILVAGLLWRAVFLAVALKHVPVSADECLTVLQALEIREGARPLFFPAQPYMFPLESYMHAPLAARIPRTAFSARYIAFLLGVSGFVISIAFLLRAGPADRIWPALLLAAFPSAYLLTLTGAFALPGYSPMLFMMLFCAWLVLPAECEDERPFAGIRWLMAGLGAGLAFSVHMLSVPLMLMLGVVACAEWVRTRRFGRLIAVLLGIGTGMLPFLIAKWTVPGAHAAVAGRYGAVEALRRFWPVAMEGALPGALGVRPTLFPDNITLSFPAGLARVLMALWALHLIVVMVWAAVIWFRGMLQNRRASFPWVLFFAGIAAISLVQFLFSKRGDAGSFRYLVPVALSLPFTLGWLLLQGRGRLGRWSCVVALCAVAILQTVRSAQMMKAWKEPGRVAELAGLPDVRPVIDYLSAEGVRHAVAPYDAAYRFTYFADGALLCAQPVNERFPGWPLPYKDEVDASTNVAFALSDAHRRFPPRAFEADLKQMQVDCRVAKIGGYRVYDRFILRGAQEDESADVEVWRPDDLRVFASHNPDAASNIGDGTPSFWRCDGFLQMTGMWIRLEWSEPRRVAEVELDYGPSRHDYAQEMKVSVRRDNEWQEWIDGVSGQPSPFAWRNGHPVYGLSVRRILLPGSDAVTGIQFEITVPSTRFAWTLADIRLVAH